MWNISRGTLLSSSSKPCPAKLTTYSLEMFSIASWYKCRPADLPTCQMNIGPPVQFIYWALIHHPSADIPTCLLIPMYIVSITYSSKCWSADLPDEYMSLSSSIEHFYIIDVPNCLLLLPMWPIIFPIQPKYFLCINLYWYINVCIPNPRWWIWCRPGCRPTLIVPNMVLLPFYELCWTDLYMFWKCNICDRNKSNILLFKCFVFILYSNTRIYMYFPITSSYWYLILSGLFD